MKIWNASTGWLLGLSSLAVSLTSNTVVVNAQNQDCNEYLDSMILPDMDDSITLSYTADVTEGVLRGRVDYAGMGWIGFAVSEAGRMDGSHAVIGLIDEGVGRYLLTSLATKTDDQENISGSCLQNDTHTSMLFEIPLEDPSGDPAFNINPDGLNNFLVAAGSSDTLGYHAMRSPLEITLTACDSSGGEAAMDNTTETEPAIAQTDTEPAMDDGVTTTALMVGDIVEAEGYITDRFCIERGTFLDTGLTTLENAEKHTVHCLLDPEPCITSVFEVLLEPLGGETLFRRGYTLDMDSKDLLVAIAKEVGMCDVCDGTGTLEAGFKASITATIVALTDETSEGSGPIISVSSANAILPEMVAVGLCANKDPVMIDIEDGQITLSLQLGTDQASGMETLTGTVVREGLGWLAFAISEGGMLGSLAVIGLPDEDVSPSNPGKYMLEQFAVEGVVLTDQQTLMDGNIEQNETHTILTFTKFIEEEGELSIDPNGDNIFLVASGSANELAYHSFRQAVPATLGCPEGVDEVAPTEPPAEDLPESEASITTGDCSVADSPITVNVEGTPISLTYEIGVDEVSGSGTFFGTVVYEGLGWLAFAISEGGMIGSLAVIGLPDEDLGSSNPGKYMLEQFSVEGIVLTDQQTLMDSNIEQNGTHTILTFTKFLEEEGELSINPNGDNTFLVAAGSTNELAYHAVRQAFPVALGCAAESELALPNLAVGDVVTIEGFVMDNFCIERGTLLDEPSIVTLEEPNLHTLHCLIDVPQCNASNYEILMDPLPGETLYRRALTLDDASKAAIQAQAKALGSCDICEGRRLQSGGGLERGFRATVTAEVMDLGDASTGVPPMVALSDVTPVIFVTDSSTQFTLEVGDKVTVTGFIMDNFCIDQGYLLDAPSIVTLQEPEKHSLHCLVDVPQCIASNYEVLLDPVPGMEDPMYTRGFVLNDAAKALVTTLAKEVGECDDCDGTGDWKFGFRAKIQGEVLELGAGGEPPLISVSMATPIPFEGMTGEADATDPPATVAPNTSDGPVDCNQFQSSITFDGTGLTMNYVVVVDEATGIGNFSAEVVYEGEGWVGFGISESGAMVGSLAVIGLPDGAVSQSNPGTYNLAGQSVSAVTLTDQQTLLAGDIQQNATHTVLHFTKLLSEPGQKEINANGANFFLVAAGSSNALGIHSQRQAANVVLAPCTAESGGATGGAQSIADPRRVSHYKAHGWMAVIAWGVLVPLAISNALSRHLIPVQGLWFQMHQGLNMLAIAMTIILFAIIVNELQKNTPEPNHFQPIDGAGALGKHKTIGLVVFILAILQGIGGLIRPHVPEGDEPKSSVRVFWEFAHKGSGVAILAMAWFQCDTGLRTYAANFGTDDYSDVFWGVAGTISAIGVIGGLSRFAMPPSAESSGGDHSPVPKEEAGEPAENGDGHSPVQKEEAEEAEDEYGIDT